MEIFKKNGLIIDRFGTHRYYKDDELHREDGPAVFNVPSDGHEEWYFNGRPHRSDGNPAVTKYNGDQYWYNHGVFHREDGPAIIKSNGYKAWYKNGMITREDGPAVEHSDGSFGWWLNNIEYANEREYRSIPIFKDLSTNLSKNVDEVKKKIKI